MAAHPSIDRLELLAQGVLADGEAAEVREHLAACAECRAHYAESVANQAFEAELRNAMEPVEAGGGSLVQPPLSLPGYEIIRELHRGGQGVVYQALQHGTRRTVAIKVMREGPLATRREKARFDREVEVLSQLNHPNIVTIYESGKAGGCFHYVMDYIEGEALDEWMARGPHSIEETLRLFVKICDAVNAAHLRGVIHRDLKPSNIRIDGNGEPHILDFGLAKVSSEDAQTEAVTITGQFLGSLPWASPEQAEGALDRIDVRTDVYSLGVILYQMLTDRFPYTVVGTMREVLDNILKAEPAKPSAFCRQINDEVETIVLKCLSKERERRYQIAGELARDIRHYLQGEPIEAKRDSTLYVLRKTLHRYRAQAGVAAGFVLLLMASLLVTSSLYVRAEKAGRAEALQHARADEKARAAEAERDRAEAAKREANERAEQLRRSVYRNYIALAQNACDTGRILQAMDLLAACPADLRRWEWYRLMWASSRRVLTLRGHRGPIMSVAWSPDGTQLVTGGGSDGTVRLWNAATGEETKSIQAHEGSVMSVTLTPDGRHVASAGGRDSIVRLWDARTGTEKLTLGGHSGAVFTVAISPDGGRLASGGADKTIRIRDTLTGANGLTLRGHYAPVRCVAFSPDGKRLVSGSNDGTARIWDVASGAPLLSLDVGKGPVFAVSFTPDGKRIVCGAGTDRLTVWDAETGAKLPALGSATGTLHAVAFSPNGKLIALGTQDGSVVILDAATGIERMTLRAHTRPTLSIAFSPDNERIASASGDGTLRIWNVAGGTDAQTLVEPAYGITSLCFSPDGKRLAAGGADTDVKVWDAEKYVVAMTLRGDTGPITSVAFSPDGKWIASGSEPFAIRPAPNADARLHEEQPTTRASDAPMLRIWDAATGAVIASLRGHTATVTGVAFTPDGARIVSSSADATLRVWDAGARVTRLTLRGHEGTVTAVAVSPDGKRIASGGQDKTVRLWDAATGREISTLGGHTLSVLAVAFSPDGRQVASGGREGTLRVWDADTGATTAVLTGHKRNVTSVIFSPDGSRILSASDDYTVKVWDPSAGVEVLTLNGHEYGVQCVAVSADGRRVASGDNGSRIIIWDAARPDAVMSRPAPDSGRTDQSASVFSQP